MAPRRWRTLAAVVLALGVLRLALVVLHMPMAGYANQYDMLRTSACLGAWPDVAPAERVLATPQAPRPAYRYGDGASEGCLPSTTVALLGVALLADRVAEAVTGSDARDFDLRQFGLLQAVLFVAVALALHRRLRGQPRWQLGHAVLFALLIADPFNTLHLNTLYTEAAGLLALYAALALLLSLVLATAVPAQTPDALLPAGSMATHAHAGDVRGPHHRVPWTTVALLTVTLLALGFSRVQHLLLPLVLASIAAMLLWPRGVRTGAVALLAVGVLVPAVQLAQQERNQSIAAANRSNAVFGALLPASGDAPRMAARLGLGATCASLEHASWYLRRGRDLAGECPQLATVTLPRMALALAAEPLALPVLVGRGLALSTAWRLPYVGEVAGGAHARLRHPSLADSLSRLGFVGHAFLWLAPLLWLAWRLPRLLRGRSDPADLLLVGACAAIVLGWSGALLGDGYSELARHLHLAQNALVLAWALVLARLWQSGMRAWRGPLPAMAVALLLALAWIRLPMAEGVLELEREGDALRAHGWAVDPSGIGALQLDLDGTLQPLPSQPATGLLRRMFPLAPAGAAVRSFDVRLEPTAGEPAHAALWVTGRHGQRSEADALQVGPELRSGEAQ